ncbi:MAG TPA: extracellular solute-binding protein [Microvirga sp.]|nr:extracellular solute-binding protein [Microvirga sp.]
MQPTKALALGLLLAATSTAALAQQKTEITLARFFGACDADYGSNTDLTKARGECGMITTLVNVFNATNKDNIVVKPQIIEWGPYYQQLTARLAARDVPNIAVMHTSQLGDFVRLTEPLDDLFKTYGIDTADFTPHAKTGVTVSGRVHAMPWDTHSWLWHINVNTFKKAGLVDPEGKPIVPKTVDELLAQAAKVKEVTGKPYFTMGTLASGDAGNGARSFYTLLYTQGASLFPSGDANKPDFGTPEAKKAFEFFETLAKNDYISKGLDGAAALGAFLNGDGAVMLTGTWRIDDFLAAQAKPDSPLKDGYTARIFPNLFKEEVVWADNHSWVLLRGGNDDKTRKAAMTFLKFMWDNNINWARGGGHLPVRISAMEEYGKLPERANVVRISEIGRSLPKEVRRQFGFQSIIGEEINNVINGGKPAAKAAADAQERADQLLKSR